MSSFSAQTIAIPVANTTLVTSGTYQVQVVTSVGRSNASSFTVLNPVVSIPTASFTINGLTNLTVPENTVINYNWSSTGGTSWTPTYSETGCTNISLNTNGVVPWSSVNGGIGLNNAYGSAAANMALNNTTAGCTIVINYNVSGPGGTISKSATIRSSFTASGITSTQIQSILSLLSSFGASNSAIANVNIILNGLTVPTSNLAPSNLTSTQIQSILSLLSSFGANSTTIANVNIILSTVEQQAPSVTGTFSYQQQYNVDGAQMISSYTYQIQNYRSGLVLDVEPTVNCNDTGIAPYKRDCSQYLFNLSGRVAENYTNVQANPYVRGGAQYRFTGLNGNLYLGGFINPSYTVPDGYYSPAPDNIDFRFILRDLNQGGKDIWSDTQRAQFKG